MIYLTGDIHGNPEPIFEFCKRLEVRREDTVIILGDVGANYFGNERDTAMKDILESLKVNILCIHGNHEMRPSTIPAYSLREWNGGMVWTERTHPHLRFAKDGEVYTIEGKRFLAIGGAYSVDKQIRIANHYGWWADEQPSEEIKLYVESQAGQGNVDYVLSHTCLFRYVPHEAFISGLDQSTIDDSTERWLDTIEQRVNYKAWYCGHWHIDKHIDRMHFLFHKFECI